MNLDYRIYINDQSGIIIRIQVDDLIIIRKNILYIKELKENLNKIFKMKDLGDLTYNWSQKYYDSHKIYYENI